jgi:hypothetical protein
MSGRRRRFRFERNLRNTVIRWADARLNRWMLVLFWRCLRESCDFNSIFSFERKGKQNRSMRNFERRVYNVIAVNQSLDLIENSSEGRIDYSLYAMIQVMTKARIIHAEKLTFIFGKVNFPTFRPCSFLEPVALLFLWQKKAQTVGRVNFSWSFFSHL